jgi:hypothetical protein
LSNEIIRHVVGGSLGLTLAGVPIGVSASLAASRLINSTLFGVWAVDPFTYGSVVAIIVSVALIAAGAPARQASDRSDHGTQGRVTINRVSAM